MKEQLRSSAGKAVSLQVAQTQDGGGVALAPENDAGNEYDQHCLLASCTR